MRRASFAAIFVFILSCVSASAGLAQGAPRATAQATKQAQPKRAARARRQRAGLPTRAGTPLFDIPGALAGEVPSERVTAPEKQSDWPAIAATPSGAIWFAYVQWNGKDADQVLVRRRSPEGKWGPPVALDDGCWDHYWPAVAARGEDALVLWSAQRTGNFELYAATVRPDGTATAPEKLTDAPYADFHVRAVADKKGNVTIVWQSFRNGQSDVYARRLVGEQWGPEIRVSPSETNDWLPAVALDSAGNAWIAWDSYEHGNYDVFLRRLSGEKLGEVVAITTEPEAQFHVSVAVDGQDRVWVAWDEAEINWGKDWSRSSAAPGSMGLHYSRKLNLRVFDGARVLKPTADLQKIMVGRLKQFAELPHLAFDGNGALWMVFRHWTIAIPTEMYHFYAITLTPQGWTKPLLLTNSSGRNTQFASLALLPNGRLAVGYASDGRAPDHLPTGDPIHALPYNGYLAVLPLGQRAPVELAAVELPPPQVPPPARPRYTMTVGGKTYTLLWGDCHRHTDIRGHSGADGSILDTYRYCLDAAPLDFEGMGDHNQVTAGSWPDGLRDYQWWYTQKLADVMHHPPTFVGVYSYEHSLGSPSGHRNIIFLKRGGPLRIADRSKGSEDNLPPRLWEWVRGNPLKQLGQKVVIVPHTFAAGPLAEWNWPNPPFDCLLEIYQGCRGSYEALGLPPGEKRGPTQTTKPGHFAQDALARGNRYGFVSFSDHRSTHNSFACVWAEEVSRSGVINAMLARRTYAASDEILLEVTADGHMVGEEFTASKPPVIKVRVKAPDTILRVDVCKNARYIYTITPNKKECSFEFVDRKIEPGLSYYYVRVMQRDPDKPDGDPEMAWASPFYVNYK